MNRHPGLVSTLLILTLASACGGASDNADASAAADAPVGTSDATPADATPADAALPDSAPCPLADETIAGTLAVDADDHTRVYVNGVLVDEVMSFWSSPKLLAVTLNRDPRRPNVIAIEAYNAFNAGGYDRGLVVDLRVETTPGDAPVTLVTDAAWKITDTLETGWFAVDHDDAAWTAPVLQGAIGMAPWGDVFSASAPGSTADWIWLYDSAAAVTKPADESMFARRTFSFTTAGALVGAPTTCP